MTAHLFQEEIVKVGDVRVTVVGRRIFAHLISTPDAALDWRQGDWSKLAHTPVAVPVPVAEMLRRYMTDCGLVFGCFDLALTGDAEDPRHWTALECNPNGQWAWLPDADAIAVAFADVLTEREE